MAKTTKSAKSERQRRIDDAMKKQRGADKRRSYVIVAACVTVGVLIVGAAAFQPVKNWLDLRQYDSIELASLGSPASTCQDVVTKQAEGVSDHLPTGTPIDYDVAPPAFGPHWNEANVAPAPFTDKFYDTSDRPPLEALVHNLEHGYTIMWYDETVADDSGEMAQIQAIAKKFKADDTNFRLKFIAAPWTSDDEDGAEFPDGQHVAFTHWQGDADKSTGVWQYCSKPSGAAPRHVHGRLPLHRRPRAERPLTRTRGAPTSVR